MPVEFIEDGRIVFNVDPQAANNLVMADDRIEFNARFSGKPVAVSIPINAVLGVYARENGEGISFPSQIAAEHEETSEDETASPSPSRGKPDLKIIK